MRHRAMRRLYRAHQRRADPLMQRASVGHRRQASHDDRRFVVGLEPPVAEGLDCRAGPPVRLLAVRPDHAGGGLAAKESQADPRSDHRPHGWQHLPLRHLQPHHRRDRKREGSLTMLQDIRSVKLSRRSFLVTTGAFGVAVAFGSLPDAAFAAGSFAPNAWVTIGEDGIVTIVPPAVEMGQGVQTSLPLILAEDLDADWSKVRVAATPDDDKVYGNPAFRNQLTTVGSFAVTGY